MYQTEAQNPNTFKLDEQSSLELVETFIQEDQQILAAISKSKNSIALAIELIYQSLSQGGRLFYFGAGTSGRLGILDAVECPPTFSTDPSLVQGIIAGGDLAIKQAVEGAEDDTEAGAKFVQEHLTEKDIAVGISASGTTPYVLSALSAARQLGAKAIGIANNPEPKSVTENINQTTGVNSKFSDLAKRQHLATVVDLAIILETGPEVLSGSTRLKAGTAQKMVLNILSTSVMVKLGKVYGNLMVDVKASNQKLIKRAINLVMKICDCSENEAQAALEQADYKVKNAVLCIKKGINNKEANELLERQQGFLSKCLN